MPSKIGKALGYPSIPDDFETETESVDDPGEADEPKGMDAEVLAMKQFKRAATPEAMVSALKAFLEACGVMSYDE